MADKSADCLHCHVMETIQAWGIRNGEKRGNKVVLDVAAVMDGLTDAIVEVIHTIPSRSQRRRALKAAHAMLDGHDQVAGKPGEGFTVEIPQEH